MLDDEFIIGCPDNHDRPFLRKAFTRGSVNCKAVVRAIFGGTDDSAQEAQIRANADVQRFIAEQTAGARKDVIPLFEGAQSNINLGAQGALDVLGQSLPAQVNAAQGGNVFAQEALLSGLPAFQNAILGTPQDFSGLQARTIPTDLSFAQQTLPKFSTGIPTPPAPTPRSLSPQDFMGIPGLLRGHIQDALSGIPFGRPGVQFRPSGK